MKGVYCQVAMVHESKKCEKYWEVLLKIAIFSFMEVFSKKFFSSQIDLLLVW